VPRKLRGTLTIKDFDDLEFRADRSTGESSQALIAQKGKSRLYRTVGAKQQSMVMHAVAPADCKDPRAFFLEQADTLTKDMESKAKPKLKGTRLLDDDDLRIVYNKTRKCLEIIMSIDLEKFPGYNNRLINLMQRTSQCFAINQTTFPRQRR